MHSWKDLRLDAAKVGYTGKAPAALVRNTDCQDCVDMNAGKFCFGNLHYLVSQCACSFVISEVCLVSLPGVCLLTPFSSVPGVACCDSARKADGYNLPKIIGP